MVYDYIIMTNLPAFYKINLYNKMAKKMNIFVVFLGGKSNIRTDDFVEGKMNFEFIKLYDDNYEERNKILTTIKLAKLLKKMRYKKIILSGWDLLESWIALIMSPKKKNCLVLESSEFESVTGGVKGNLKKLFLKKCSVGFPSGKSQHNLFSNLNFKGDIFYTKGVGIFNRPSKKEKSQINSKIKYLYVGRLSPEKNLINLIKVFNELQLDLSIAGKGPLESELKKLAKENIKFLGHIPNEEIGILYTKHDVFILPSISEVWGLVVDEAFYYGLPVIVSNRVGCHTEIIDENETGIVFDIDNNDKMKEAILKLNSFKTLDDFKKNVNQIDFIERDEIQVNSYLRALKQY